MKHASTMQKYASEEDWRDQLDEALGWFIDAEKAATLNGSARSLSIASSVSTWLVKYLGRTDTTLPRAASESST